MDARNVLAELLGPMCDLRNAIRDEGPVPHFHRDVMARHQTEWPTLWSAINSLLYHLDNEFPPEDDDRTEIEWPT